MSKRTKQVFTNSQLSHVWAQQTQDTGRTSSGSMYFSGTDIFSYGSHYLAARIYTVKGKKFALVNSHNYSSTTSQHLGYIRSALSGLMPYFCVSRVSDLKASTIELDLIAQNSIANALKRLKITDKRSIGYEFENIRNAFEDANKLRKLLGKGEKNPTKKQLKEVQDHLDARLKRYHELNTPEMIEKRIAAKAKSDKVKEAKELEKQSENIAEFREGKTPLISGLKHALLRIKGNEVETSSGAIVPLNAAFSLYRAISSGKPVVGLSIGHFTIERVSDIGDDTEVKIGCHLILMSEATKILGANQNYLKLA